MPYLILVIGLFIGLVVLYRFFLTAELKQIKALFLTAGLLVFCLAVLYLSLTGRLPAALALIAAAFPFALSFWNKTRQKKEAPINQTPSPMTKKQALEVLGLESNADKKEIEKAYKKLMNKLHPDKEGSEWMAAKLNEARDTLLKEKPPKS